MNSQENPSAYASSANPHENPDPSAWAHEVIPRVWLGNFQSASSSEWLQSHGIQAIFNCTKNIPFVMDPGYALYRIPLDDNLQAEEIRNALLWSFEAVYRMAAEYNAGRTILVHCHAGMQRSAAMVAMFIIFLTLYQNPPPRGLSPLR
jgi:protein-tyrosine phosphatase